jgi:hypothetical protein
MEGFEVLHDMGELLLDGDMHPYLNIKNEVKL